MLENLDRDQLLSILQEIVRYCTHSEEYYTKHVREINDELDNNPDDETFYELLRSRAWHNSGLNMTESVLRIVKDYSDAFNEDD